MTARVWRLTGVVVLAAALALLTPWPAHAQTARDRYTNALARDEKARLAVANATAGSPLASDLVKEIRAAIAAYQALVRRYPLSGYSDNALHNAAVLADTLYQRTRQASDREVALKLYRRIGAEYPGSSLVKHAEPAIVRLAQVAHPAPSPPPTATTALEPRKPEIAGAGLGRARLTGIDRTVLGDLVRVTLSLDREVAYHDEAIDGPARVFFDLRNVDAAPHLSDAVLRYPSDVVRQIRVGRHPSSTVRVVLDLEGVRRHSVYTLYNPFRVVIDFEAATTAPAAAVSRAVRVPSASPALSSPPAPAPAAAIVAEPALPVPARETTPLSAAAPAPEAPNANTAGGFSLARQLGLGVSRVVIDPGHGGHDPGAQARGLSEAELTLDIALRLEQLLQKEPGLDVVLTRRNNEYVPLDERTAIANREGADLFLSIHANASRNASARGVETYFLSFAATPEAEAVAARENAAHAGEMRELPDIIKAIALNNKLDESRDLAGMVQEALVARLRRSNKDVRNLGVKKAPFVVLVGAGMPSVLAEVSFLTNRQELQLLKTPAYKQRIAEALHAAVLRYRRSLKGQATIASQ